MTENEVGRRSRIINWQDPMIGANAMKKISGMEYLSGMVSGEIPPPPIAQLIGARMVKVDSGYAVFEFKPEEYHYNPIGSVHGGVASTVLDSAMACALHSTLPTGSSFTMLELKVNFIRAISMQTGLMRCEGRVIHAGNRIATAKAEVTDENGKLYCHATSTCMIFRPENPLKQR
jgi:uncharacterized protein (TIGR00369 family)